MNKYPEEGGCVNAKQEHVEPSDSRHPKPPIGLRPKRSHDSMRLHEVRGAIARYYDAGVQIPVEWVEEYNDLIACGLI